MNIEQWQNWLIHNSACTSGLTEAKDKLPNDWYQTTQRGDWMIWVLRKIPNHKNDKNLWVKIAIESAKLVIHLSKDPQQRPQKAIEAAEKWLNNPSEENRKDATYAAAAAADAAADAADAAYATYATYAAAAAAYAATYAAAAAAYAAAYAATYAAAAARQTTKGKIANVIRSLVKTLVIEATNDN